MKKALTLMATLCIVVMLFVACDNPGGTVELPSEPTEQQSCEHSWAEANCTTPKTCTLCQATEGKAKGHTEETVVGKGATCTEAGLTEGKKCSACGEITVAQQTIPAKGHTEGAEATCTTAQICTVCDQELVAAKGHVEETIAGKGATCTEAGLTDGKKCSVCGEITVAQQTISAKGHVEVTVAGKAATCTETGLTDGKKCSACNVTLAEQKEIAANGHKDENEDFACDVCKENLCTEHVEQILAGREATCTEAGLTEGKKCSACDKILVAQETIPAKGHTEGAEATCTTAQTCTVCDKELVAAKGHVEVTVTGKEATCTEAGLTDGKKCSVCNVTLVEQTEIEASGHKDENEDFTCDVCDINLCTAHVEQILAGKKATCTEAGLTEGKKCSQCDEILVAQETIPAKGHTEAVLASKAATCTETGLTEGKKCSDCGEILVAQETILAKGHESNEDDGDITTAVTCKRCDYVFVEAKEAITLNLPSVENGTIQTDKKQYEPGDTVTLTITPSEGYSQKLYINGEPLLLDWKTNTYSFVASEKVYNITGDFEPNLGFGTSDKWDTVNEAHGIISTYYTSGDSSWFGIDGGYESISVKAKNYIISEDGNDPDGFHIMLGIKINGKNYNFRIIRQSGKYYCQRAGFAKPEGGSDWTKKELDEAAIEALRGDGVDFKLERIAADKLAVYVNGEIYDTYTMSGVTAEHKATRVFLGHDGNDGEKVAIPFAVAKPIFSVTSGNWNLNDQYDNSLTIVNKTTDGTTVTTNANTYKEVSVTVKDYTPSKNADGSLKKGNFSVQVALIFDDGKMFEIRIHNTNDDGNYKLQKVGGSDKHLTGWGWVADLTTSQKANLLDGNGAKFTVKLEGSNAVMYVDDQKMATVALGDAYNGKTAQIKLCLNGSNSGTDIEIPFELK